jgi:hypothetical protein
MRNLELHLNNELLLQMTAKARTGRHLAIRMIQTTVEMFRGLPFLKAYGLTRLEVGLHTFIKKKHSLTKPPLNIFAAALIIE